MVSVTIHTEVQEIVLVQFRVHLNQSRCNDHAYDQIYKGTRGERELPRPLSKEALRTIEY